MMSFQGGSLVSPEVGITGGTLTGFGTINTNVPYYGVGVCSTAANTGGVCNTGDTVAPRGILSINGNYLQGPGGTLSVTTGGVSADQLAVSGTAAVGGALQIALAAQSVPIANNTTYAILTSGGLSGTFDGTDQLSAFISGTVTYTGNNVDLTLNRTESYEEAAMAGGADHDAEKLAAVLDAARTQNSAAIAPILAELDTGSLGDATTFFDDASGVETGNSDVVANQLLANQATARLVQGTIEQHLAALRDNNTDIVQRGAGLNDLSISFGSRTGFLWNGDRAGTQYAALDGGPAAEPAPAALPGPVWVQGIGAWQSIGADSNAGGVSQTVGGVIAGIDLPLATRFEGLQGGGAFSYTHGDLGGSGGGESGTSDVYRGTVYGTQALGPAFIDGQFSYGYTQMATTRAINVPDIGLSQAATGSTSGSEYSTAFSGGYRYIEGPYLIEPSLGLAWDRVTRGAYAESNAGALNLDVNGSSLDSLRFSGGARAAASFTLDNGMQLRPELQARYAYDALTPASTTTIALQGVPGLPFPLTGVNIGRSAAVLGAGVTLAQAGSLALYVDYNAELRSRETVHAVVGGLRLLW
jgi:outer membrane autotransporter protein